MFPTYHGSNLSKREVVETYDNNGVQNQMVSYSRRALFWCKMRYKILQILGSSWCILARIGWASKTSTFLPHSGELTGRQIYFHCFSFSLTVIIDPLWGGCCSKSRTCMVKRRWRKNSTCFCWLWESLGAGINGCRRMHGVVCQKRNLLRSPSRVSCRISSRTRLCTTWDKGRRTRNGLRRSGEVLHGERIQDAVAIEWKTVMIANLSLIWNPVRNMKIFCYIGAGS